MLCGPGEPARNQARLRPHLPGGVVHGGMWHGMGGTLRGTVRSVTKMKEQEGFMAREIDAIYENGVLRPLEPLDLEEQQHVRITIDNGDSLADLLDTEFMEWCARKAAGDVPSIEEVRQMLSQIKGSMADVVIAERDERF